MEGRNFAVCSTLFLILGFIGLVVFWFNSLNTPSIATTLQVSTTIYMILLSLGLFFISNETKLVKIFGLLSVKGYEFLAFTFVLGGIIVIEFLSLIAENGLFLPPLFLGSITLGFFFATKRYNLL